MMRPNAPVVDDDEESVRAPDAPQRIRLVEAPPATFDDELGWTDNARIQVAVQISAVLLAATWQGVGERWRPAALALLATHASACGAAQRQRRAPLAAAQVFISTSAVVAFAGASPATRAYVWRSGAFVCYALEALGWHRPVADLVDLAFPRFQHALFATLVVATYVGMPPLYAFAEKLEIDAAAGAPPPGAPSAPEFGPDAVSAKLAAAVLYGGTSLMLGLSASIWYRMYVLAPDLFRVFTTVVVAGVAAGLGLYVGARADDVQALAGATAVSFAVMAYLALDRIWAKRSVVALALGLYPCFALLDRGTFAFACFATQVAVKVHALYDLHVVRGRSRTTARLDHPAAAFLLPSVVA